jgi:hypothetical protein
LDRMSRRTFVGIGTNQSGTYHVRENERTHKDNGLSNGSGTNRSRSLAGFPSLSALTLNTSNSKSSSRKLPLKTIKCIVHFLDRSQHTFEIDVSVTRFALPFALNFRNVSTFFCFAKQKRSKGQTLLDTVFCHLELVERDYFGLQYIENKAHIAHAFLSTQMFHFSQGQTSSRTRSESRNPDVYVSLSLFSFYFCATIYVYEPLR